MRREVILLILWAKPYWALLAAGVLTVLAAGGATLLLLNLARQSLTTTSDSGMVQWVWLALALTSRAVFGFLGTFLLGQAAVRAITYLRVELFTRFMHAPVRDHDRNWSADMVSRLITDAAFVQEALATVLPGLALHLPIVCVTLVLLLAESWKVSISILLLGLPMMLLVLVIGRGLRRLTRLGQTRLGQMAVLAQESFLGIRMIKASIKESFFVERFAASAESHYRLKQQRVLLLSLLEGILPVVGLSILLIGILIAQQEAVEGRLSPSQLGIYAAYLIVFGTSSFGLVRVSTSIESITGAAQRIIEVFLSKEQAESTMGVEVVRRPGVIAFENVTFRYPSGGGVSNITFEVAQGEILALVGPNGAGKTTLVNLLLRFYEPQGGCIKVDTQNSVETSLVSWRRQFALVSRDPAIFSLSIAGNMALGKREAKDVEILRAARVLGLHDFIQSLPEGYNTHVGENGLKLSAGQRQRIALARILLQDPSVVILDEATTSVDRETGDIIAQLLKIWAQTSTVIIIAHHLDPSWPISRVIHLEGGRLVAQSSSPFTAPSGQASLHAQ